MTVATAQRAESPSLRHRLLVAAGSGLLLASAFPPVDLLRGWAAVPAFALLTAAFRGLPAGGGAAVSLASGLAFFLPLLDWMRVLGPDAWLLLTLLCAAFWAAAGAAMPALLSRRWWIVTVPLLWVAVEALRARIPWGGFPWGRLAFAQAGTELAGWAALGGPALVTFAVALVGTVLLAAWDAGRARRPGAVLSLVALAAAVVVGGALTRSAGWGGPDGATAAMAVVQGNVPRLGLDFNAQRRAVLDNHVTRTRMLAAEVAAGRQPQPVAVIWPENSSDIDPVRHADAAEQIDLAADAIGAPILVGAVLNNPDDPPKQDHPGTILNVGLVWDPETGPGQRYLKRHPVPFGEYLPFRDALSQFITRFDRVPRDFVGGEQPGFLTIGRVPIGIVICFETAYDDLVRDAVRAGGAVMVVQTNNATYGGTGQPEQQLAISRVQSVATGRPTLVAATSGISAVIDGRGELTWHAPENTADSGVFAVTQRTGRTPAVQLGPLPELAAILALGVLAVLGRQPRPAGRQC
ncbi:MAG: apolipoprotein N-acyltransferase [Candidatus Nanopelagicales bacterium]